jgi:RNA polymerase sigma-70 factor (subfamily 1)
MQSSGAARGGSWPPRMRSRLDLRSIAPAATILMLAGARCKDVGMVEGYYDYLKILVRLGYPAHLGTKFDPSDVVQEVLVRALASDGDLAARTENERLAFLRKLCAATLADHVRFFGRDKRRASLERSLDDSAAGLEAMLAGKGSSPGQTMSRHEQLLRLARALGALPENQRRVVELHHLKGHSLAETAAMLAISKHAVAGLLRRGLSTLRAWLEETGPR